MESENFDVFVLYKEIIYEPIVFDRNLFKRARKDGTYALERGT